MNSKIAIVGNSHIAAFKLGWDLVKYDYPELELIFFGSPTTSMRFLRVQNGALVPTQEIVAENFRWTSGTHDHIPGNMDAYILVGMGFSFVHLLALLKNHSLLNDYDGSKHLISESFLQSAMEGTLINSNAIQVVNQLQSITSAPLVYVPNPYASIDILSSSEHSYFNNVHNRARMFNYYSTALDQMSTEKSVLVARQPDCTVVGEVFTKSEYSKGSIKLKRGMASLHNDNDYFHMNAEFGSVSIRKALEKLL